MKISTPLQWQRLGRGPPWQGCSLARTCPAERGTTRLFSTASCSPGWLGNWFCRDRAKGWTFSEVLPLLAPLPFLWLFGPCPFQGGQCPIGRWKRATRGCGRTGDRAGNAASRRLVSHLLFFGRLKRSLSPKYIQVRMTHPSSQDSNLQ